MNLYYAVTNYHILCCILHSIIYHSQEENVLYLSNWHPDAKELIKNLIKSKLFNRVEIFEEVTFPSGNQKITSQQIKKDINWILNRIPNKFIKDVEQSSEINIAGDHYCCSLYLVTHKIPYNYLEEACGVLSDEERLMKIIRNIDYSRFQIMKKLKLPGNHSYIVHRYGDLNHQLPGYSNKKDFHFSVSEILKKLNEKEISKIIKVFSREDFHIQKNATLLLTFHYINMNLMSMDDQRLLYYLLVDYFFDSGSLVIKQHPSDRQPNYFEWFPNSVILPRKLPSELLPVLSKNKFSRALTSYSTSVFSLKEYCGDVISFNANIEKTFKSINKYYFLLKILNKLSIDNYKIIGFGLDDSIVNQLSYQYKLKKFEINFVANLDKLDIENKKIILLDDFDVHKVSDCWSDVVHKDDIVIFLNFEKLDLLIRHNEQINCSQIFSVFLEKKILDKKKYVNNDILCEEIICFYNISDKLMDKISRIKENKILKYCNISISQSFNFFTTYLDTYRKKIQLDKEIVQLKEQNNVLLNKSVNLEQDLNQSRVNYESKVKECETLNSQLAYYQELYNNVISSSSWRMTSWYRKVGAFIKQIVRKFKNKK